MIPFLAEADPSSTGLFIQGASAVMLFLVLLFQVKSGLSGKSGERKIEPTEMASISSELKSQTLTLNKLDREMGEVRRDIRAVDEKVGVQIKAVDDRVSVQNQQVDNAFKRINAISQESASVKDRLTDHLSDHREGRFRA